jgi:SSS family solute:Na+ symporter
VTYPLHYSIFEIRERFLFREKLPLFFNLYKYRLPVLLSFAIKGWMKPEFLFSLLVYFLFILLGSFFFSRKMKSLEDFFLASRNLPFLLVFSSLVASWFGATSVLVSTDEAYNQGISAFWVMGVPAILTVLIFGLFLARPIRRLPLVSLPDLVELRYGPLVRHLASLLIIWYMVLLASSQMVAMGNFLKMFLGTSYFVSLLIVMAVVLLYSTFGGFFSVALTDGIQFFLLVAGMMGLFIFLSEGSSLKEISRLAAQTGRPHYFDFFFDMRRNILIVLSFTLAWTISPIVWQRIQAARKEKEAGMALFSACGTFFILYGIVIFIGILALPLFLSPGLQGSLLSEIISSKAGMFLGCLLFVAVVAAVMSTMDTAINTGALSLTRDVYQQVYPASSQRSNIWASRFSTIVIGILAFLIATRFQSILKALGLASEIMAEGLFIPGIAMIFLRKKLPAAGLLSLLFGGGYALFGFLCQVRLLPIQWIPWPQSVPYGIALCALGFCLGVLIEKFNK